MNTFQQSYTELESLSSDNAQSAEATTENTWKIIYWFILLVMICELVILSYFSNLP